MRGFNIQPINSITAVGLDSTVKYAEKQSCRMEGKREKGVRGEKKQVSLGVSVIMMDRSSEQGLPQGGI